MFNPADNPQEKAKLFTSHADKSKVNVFTSQLHMDNVVGKLIPQVEPGAF